MWEMEGDGVNEGVKEKRSQLDHQHLAHQSFCHQGKCCFPICWFVAQRCDSWYAGRRSSEGAGGEALAGFSLAILFRL